MVSAAMDIQDQSGCSGSNTIRSTGNGISMGAGYNSVNSELKDQFTDDYALKARKPYTITKQRERWTDEEHKKFLEALKLYGRAWRRIEEYVGTKTAVQIRSHAQKFFSKVVRESSSSDANSVKPIEIPPPRPKRKPMHPYPRKNVSPFKNGTHLPDEQRRSMSPNVSVSEQENQFPTTVLSAIGSVTDLSTPNSSPPPISSTAGSKCSGLLPSEPNLSPEENGSSSPVEENASSSPAEHVPMKSEHLELFPADKGSEKEGSAEAASTQSLKLFGKTVLVTDSHRPSSPGMMGNCNKLLPRDQNLAWNIMPMKISPGNEECSWNTLPCGPPAALYYMHLSNENSNPAQAGSAPLPWTPFPVMELRTTVPVKAQVSLDGNEAPEKELQKEGSWTGSNTGPLNAGGDGDKSWECETQSNQPFCVKEENEQKPAFMFKLSLGGNYDKRKRGFVPYKRCLAERDTHSSTITGDEREELRIRLCL